jgi:hypothetical protein
MLSEIPDLDMRLMELWQNTLAGTAGSLLVSSLTQPETQEKQVAELYAAHGTAPAASATFVKLARPLYATLWPITKTSRYQVAKVAVSQAAAKATGLNDRDTYVLRNFSL